MALYGDKCDEETWKISCERIRLGIFYFIPFILFHFDVPKAEKTQKYVSMNRKEEQNVRKTAV